MIRDGAADLPVEQLIQALRAHAAAVASTSDPTALRPVIDGLRDAALAYDHAVFDRTGWYAGLLPDKLDLGEWDEDQEDEFTVAEGVQRLTLTGRWDFLVRDEEALQALAADRLRTDNPDLDAADLAEHTQGAGAALNSLVAMDTWAYVGLEDAGAEWSVSPIEKTLFEMSVDEREFGDL